MAEKEHIPVLSRLIPLRFRLSKMGVLLELEDAFVKDLTWYEICNSTISCTEFGISLRGPKGKFGLETLLT
jgi:hypothetical protein